MKSHHLRFVLLLIAASICFGNRAMARDKPDWSPIQNSMRASGTLTVPPALREKLSLPDQLSYSLQTGIDAARIPNTERSRVTIEYCLVLKSMESNITLLNLTNTVTGEADGVPRIALIKISQPIIDTINNAWAALSTAPAAQTNSLQVIAIPATNEVRRNEPFKVALRVENTKATTQTVKVMNCSWEDEWKTSTPNISWLGQACDKNFMINVAIPPGGAYTNQMEMLVPKSVSEKQVTFRLGFTPIESPTTYWSDDMTVEIK